MHASQLNHGILYMQVKKGTMTTLVKLTVVLEVSSLAVCRMCVFWGGGTWMGSVCGGLGRLSISMARRGRQWQAVAAAPGVP
jgi:hypothetical protein